MLWRRMKRILELREERVMSGMAEVGGKGRLRK
jgi:hypothetical protein